MLLEITYNADQIYQYQLFTKHQEEFVGSMSGQGLGCLRGV